MNSKQILACFFIALATNSVETVAAKVAKKVVDIAGLTVLLQRHGYEIVSSKAEKFEAQKKNMHTKLIEDTSIPFFRRTEKIEKIDFCKITQLGDDEDFFVEVSNTESIKELLDHDLAPLDDEEDRLIEESCSSHKETVLVIGLERAVQVAASFFQKR